MREKTVEQKLVMAVKKMGGICPKWVSPGFDGRASAGSKDRFCRGEGAGEEAKAFAGVKAWPVKAAGLYGVCPG